MSNEQYIPVASSSQLPDNSGTPPTMTQDSINPVALIHQGLSQIPWWSIHTILDAVIVCHNRDCEPCAQYVRHLFLHQGIYGLPLDGIKQAVDTAWPLLVKKIRREAAKPLKARITDLEGEMQHTKDRCSDVIVKNHHLYQDVQDLEDDLDDARRECASLHEKA
jgi:hypothetical protein